MRANRLIFRVGMGALAEGIAEGEKLLAEAPQMAWFRGHLAHWHAAAGDAARARHHYERLLRDNPGDRAVKELLARL